MLDLEEGTVRFAIIERWEIDIGHKTEALMIAGMVKDD